MDSVRRRRYAAHRRTDAYAACMVRSPCIATTQRRGSVGSHSFSLSTVQCAMGGAAAAWIPRALNCVLRCAMSSESTTPSGRLLTYSRRDTGAVGRVLAAAAV
jgi:hypothetical protein